MRNRFGLMLMAGALSVTGAAFAQTAPATQAASSVQAAPAAQAASGNLVFDVASVRPSPRRTRRRC
jgi:guanyl-specific ribonuclease Sa